MLPLDARNEHGLGNPDAKGYSYDGISDPNLRLSLERVEKVIEQETWPKRIKDLTNTFRFAFDGLSSTDFDLMVFRARDNKIIAHIDEVVEHDGGRSSKRKVFDQDRARALAAIIWEVQNRFPLTQGSTTSRLGTKRIPWGEVAESVKEALGDHSLTEHVHDVHPTLGEVFFPKRTEEVARPPTTAVVVFSNTQEVVGASEEFFNPSSKIPKFNDKALATLAGMDRLTIAVLRRKITDSAGRVDLARYYVPLDVLRAAMFVRAAHTSRLEDFDPQQKEFMGVAVKEALGICEQDIITMQETSEKFNTLEDVVSAITWAIEKGRYIQKRKE